MRRVIVFGVRSDYTETAYSNLKKQKGFKYYKSVLFRKYISFCYRHKIRISKFVLNIFYFLFLLKYRKNDQLLFIYHGVDNLPLLKYGFCSFCKKTKNKSYHIGVYWDIFDFEKMVDASLIKKELDDSFIIDQELAKQYGISYYPLFYTKTQDSSNENNNKVFFCGEDGGRLDNLKQIATFLKKNNVEYLFYCSNSNDEYIDKYSIHYIKRMEHSTYINEVKKCSILLDITKPGATCCSLRLCEAVLYDKKLLSDNVNIKTHMSFDKRYMSYFDVAENIDLDFIKNKLKINYPSKEYVLPDGFIKTIYKKIDNKEYSR